MTPNRKQRPITKISNGDLAHSLFAMLRMTPRPGPNDVWRPHYDLAMERARACGFTNEEDVLGEHAP